MNADSELVKAYLYHLINPVIEKLEQEEYYLKTRNPTWRQRTSRCKQLRFVYEYVQEHHLPIWRQFLDEYSNIDGPVISRDDALEVLCGAAGALHSKLCGLSSLKRLANALETAELQSWRATYSFEEGIEILAENIVNWRGGCEPTSRHIGSSVWNAHSDDLVTIGNEQASLEIDAFDTALSNYSDDRDKLLVELEGLRKTLTTRYQIPAVSAGFVV